MAFKMERVKRTGTQKRIIKLKVKPRGLGKKNGNYHFHGQGFFWQLYRYLIFMTFKVMQFLFFL